MPGIYLPRHQERTVLYRVLFLYFECFLHLHFLVAHLGKVRKASPVALALWMTEDEPRCVPSKGWAEMIRKV